MKSLILGDIHLGAGQNHGKQVAGNTFNSKVNDQIHLLDWTLDQAIDNEVSDIIITGDVFEEPKPPPALITLFINWVKKCSAHHVAVHIITGNHDVLRSGALYSSPLDIISEMEIENISVYKDISTIIIGTTAFTLMPFRDRKSLNCDSNKTAVDIINNCIVYETSGIPQTYKKVVIGHFAIEGSIPVGNEIDDLVNELFLPISMFSGYDYVWMGHVHKPQILNKKTPYVAHIGSMDISNFGETEQKKIIIIFDCLSGDFISKEIPTRSMKKIPVLVPTQVADATAYVLDHIKKIKEINGSTVRVEITLESPDTPSVNKKEIEKFLINSGSFHVHGVLESKQKTVIKKDASVTMDSKMDVKTAIKSFADNYVDPKIVPEFLELSYDIYNAVYGEKK